MRKLLMGACALTLLSGLAFAEMHDWRDLELIHRHITESIHEMERARAANHYDMKGHGAKAEQLLHEAQREVHEAIEAAKEHH